jgi:hypothetical protein
MLMALDDRWAAARRPSMRRLIHHGWRRASTRPARTRKRALSTKARSFLPLLADEPRQEKQLGPAGHSRVLSKALRIG